MFQEIILLLTAARLVAGQDITVAPPNPQTSRVSITSDLEYALQRSCVAHCLYYNGGFVRGPYHHDWDDVGGELGCGWAPINGCYCNTKYASSATAYFSTCIPYYCGSGDDADPENLVSALSLYNSYCVTANGNPTKPVPVPVTIAATTTSQPEETTSETSAPGTTSAPVSEPTQEAKTEPSSASEGLATAEQKTASTSTGALSTTTASTGGSGGLSKGATIGIAVGASIGGVALIAVAVVLFLSRRKKSLGGKEHMGGIEG